MFCFYYITFEYKAQYIINIDLISGVLESTCNNIRYEKEGYSAVNLWHGGDTTFKLSGATLKSAVGYGIYDRNGEHKLNISGGKIESKNDYGIYSEFGTSDIAISGDPVINGGIAGIKVRDNDKIDITGELTGGHVTFDVENEGVFTTGYSKYNNDTNLSQIFSVANGGRIFADETGELSYSRNIASDEKLCDWAAIDYEKKSDDSVANSDINAVSDTEYEITLKDINGNVLDVYTIDPTSGNGTNSDGTIIRLPKTGNNSMAIRFVFLCSLVLIVLGIICIKCSFNIRFKKNKQ